MQIKLLVIALFFSAKIISQSPGFKIINKPSVIEESELTTESEAQDQSTEDVYKTIDIIRYNYLDVNKTLLETEKQTSMTDLYSDSRAAIGDRMDPDARKAKEDRLIEIDKELTGINHQRDSLYHNYLVDFIQYRRYNVLYFGPQRAEAFFDLLYNQKGSRFKLINNAGLNFGGNAGSIYSELASGNLGIFRVSFGAMVSSSSSADTAKAKSEEAYQRLTTLGGNTALTFEYPLVYVHARDNSKNFITRLIARGTADLPQFGTQTRDFAASGAFGFDFYADASTSNNAIRFFSNFNIFGIVGSDSFKSNLKVTTPDFHFGQLTLGFVFASNLKVSFIVATFSSQKNLTNRTVVGGGQVLR